MKRGKTKKSVKKKTNSSKKCKMPLRNKEFLAVTILVFFVFAFLLAVTNTPQQNTTITGQAVEGINLDATKIGTALTNIMNPEKADSTVIKWVTFFTFVLGIWGALSAFGVKNGVFKLLAFPIAFAMVYLINPSEIFSALIGYSALGMTLIVIAPFIAIVFFSVHLLEGKLSAAKIIMQLIVWYFYLAFLIYYLLRALFFGKEAYSFGIIIIILIAVIISIIIIWKNKPWRKWIAKLKREGISKTTEDVQEALSGKDTGEFKRGEEVIKQAEKSKH